MTKVGLWVSALSIVALFSCNNNSPDKQIIDDTQIPLSAIDLRTLGGETSRQEFVEGELTKGSIDFGEGTINYFTTKENMDDQAYPKESSPLSVVDFAPTGELPIEASRPTIYVMFNHPIVPLAKLGEPITDTDLMKIDPPLKGVYRWYGTKVLSFQPDETLVNNPRYSVTVSGKIKSLGGNELGGDFHFDFYTEAIKIVNWYVGNNPKETYGTYDVPPAVAKFITVEFNQDIDIGEIRNYLKVNEGGNDLGFDAKPTAYKDELASRNKRSLIIELRDPPPEDTRVYFSLSDKAKPKPNYPSRKGVQSFSFQTLQPFAIRDLSSYSYDFPTNNVEDSVPVYVNFSHRLKGEVTKSNYSLFVNGKLTKPATSDVFGETLRLVIKKLKPNDLVEFVPDAATSDVFNRKLSNPDSRIGIRVAIPSPYFDFPDETYVLESAFPPKFIWSGRNLLNLSVAIGKSELSSTPKLFDLSKWKPNKVNYEVVDLKPHLNKEGFGTVLMSAAAKLDKDSIVSSSASIQVTDMGLSVRVAYNKVLVWVNSFKTGLPRPNTKVEVFKTSNFLSTKSATTNAQGLAVIDLGDNDIVGLFPNNYQEKLHIRATSGTETADLDFANTVNAYVSSVPDHETPLNIIREKSRVLMFTDRGLYKPGEELALRGIHWVQNQSSFKAWAGASFSLQLKDSRSGKILWTQDGKTTESGGFATKFNLPKDMEPGQYFIKYLTSGPKGSYESEEFTAEFTIAAFRKLAFQIKASLPPQNIYLGEDATVNINATYLAGGSMPNAPYSYYWTRRPMAYEPPGESLKPYVFGPGNWEGEHTLNTSQAKLSGSGGASISVHTDEQNATGSAYDYVLETTITDIDRQSISNTSHVTVHPASFYLGLRFASNSTDGWWSRFVSTNTNTKTQIVLVDPDGRPWSKAQKLSARLIKGDWKATEQQGVYGQVNTRWEYVEEEISKQDFDARDGKADFNFSVKDAGDYLLSIEGKDERGRLTKTVIRFYATGSNWVRRASETPSEIEFIADKSVYNQGDTAKLLIRSPIEEGDYLMTIEREGILENKIIHLKGGQSLLEVPIKESYIPIVYVALTSFTKREAAPKDYFDPDLGRPRSLFGVIGLNVSTKPIELDIEILANQKAFKPGTNATVNIRVTNKGKPVAGAEVTAIAVDRGVLDLINYHVPNPVEYFYDPYNFPLGVQGDDSRRLLLKPVSYATDKLTGGDGDKPTERKDFRPLALFEPFAKTNQNGVATVTFKLPDNLTTYRVTGLAVEKNRVGISEGELLVQNPINVRAALPRLFRVRDTAAGGVILQNLSSETQKVTVSVESDILSLGATNSKTVEVKANGSYELPFVLSATRAGTGTISFTIKSNLLNEKLTEKVSVERPLITEAFSTIGTISKDQATATEGLILSSNIAPGYGNLSFMADTTLRPYIEPSLARLGEVPLAYEGYYRKLLYAFSQVYLGQKKDYVTSLLSELAKRQLSSGGIYTGSYAFSPYLEDAYVSLTTAHLLAFIKERKFDIKTSINQSKLLGYLKSLSNKPEERSPYMHAYVVYVLAISGSYDAAYTQKVTSYEDKLGLGGYGLLTQTYLASKNKSAAQAIFDRSKNFIQIGTQTLDLKDSYEVNDYFSSLKAELALYLKNAYQLDLDADYIQRIANALKRNESYWTTLNDDLWNLLGFIPILDKEGKRDGDTRVSLELQKSLLADLTIKASQTNVKSIFEFNQKPLLDFPRDSLQSLSINKSSKNPLYYTMIMQYALPNETAIARDEGISVSQTYETLDGKRVGPKDLKLGDTYRVRVDLGSTKDRNRLQLVVPIASGLEIVDSNFVTTSKFANQGGTGDEQIVREGDYGDTVEVSAEGYAYSDGFDWSFYWYRPDMFALDNAMVYRWANFYKGARTVSFLVRVTTPGIYPTPPATAKLEFEPEVFGRSSGQLFVIKP